jgi:serine/threonine protein kinase
MSRRREGDPSSPVAGGRCRLVERLSTDCLGAVWRAQDLEAGGPVTVRELRDDLVAHRRFVRWLGIEIRPVSLLRHPHVLEAVGLGGDDRSPTRFVMMASVEGETLAARVAREGPLEPAEAEAIAKQVRDALVAAHRLGLVHGGLSADSVLLTPDGGIKVFDFGIATALWFAGRHANGASDTNGAIDAAREPDRASDERSLALLKELLLTGQRPNETPLPALIDLLLAGTPEEAAPERRGPSPPDRRVAVGAIAAAAVVAASVGFLTLRSPAPQDDGGSTRPTAPPVAEASRVASSVAVPDVGGLSAMEARRRLEARGLVVADAQPADGPPGVVIGTSPATRQLVPPGTAVTLLVGAPPDRQEAP